MRHIVIKCTDTVRLSRLLPLLLMENGFDIIDLFSNGDDRLDTYCKTLEKHYSKSVKWHSKDETDNFHSKDLIGVDGDYYLYLNENVIYLERCTINRLFSVKEKNPQYFLTTPLTINHWLGCYLLQNNENYNLGSDTTYQYEESFDGNDFIYADGEEAERVHRSFIWQLDDNGVAENAHISNFECCTRFPMVCVCWAGKDMAKLLDEYDVFNDEPFLTYQYPAKMGLKNLVVGNKVMAYYAYEPQKPYLDKTDIAARYKAINSQMYGNTKIYETLCKWCDRLRGETVNVDKGKLTIYKFVNPSEEVPTIDDDWCKTVRLNAVNCEKIDKCDYSDNEGKLSISEKYPYYGTLTGIYWLIRNIPKNVQYVGIDTVKAHWNVSKEDVARGMAAYDILVPNKKTNENIAAMYAQNHSKFDIAALEGIVKEYFPEYRNTWLGIMNNDNQMMFLKNCVIAKRNVFIKMWRFVFDVLDKFCSMFRLHSDEDIIKHVQMFSENKAPQEMNGDWMTYQSRMFEFMAERLMNLYIYKHYNEIGLGQFTIEE